jgi:D-psicose/D-tagatose/L-ribulose 3-epimerase
MMAAVVGQGVRDRRLPPLGVSAWIYGDAPLDATLARIAAAGYDGVELPGEPDRWPPAEVRRLLARHGLAPLALTASCTFPETRRDLAHPDPAIRADAVRYLVRCLEWAAEIGSPLAQMLPSGETRLWPLAAREAEWAWSVAGMRVAAGAAERLGVRIAVEPLNRYEAYLVTSAADALAYLDDVGSPWVGLTLDLFHANIEEPDVAASIRAAGPRLWHVQVADTNRQGLGRGHADLAPVVDALAGIGYDGAVVLEVTAPGPDPFQPIKDDRSAGILDGYLRGSLGRLRAAWGATATAGRDGR